MFYAGLRIVPSLSMTRRDWSHVRSPSRAIRRARLGHRQNWMDSPDPEAVIIGDVRYMHPETMREFSRILKEREGKTRSALDVVGSVTGRMY